MVMMKLLTWNVRGLERKEKKSKIKRLLKDRGIDIALFKETKKAFMSEKEIKEIWARDRMEYTTVDAEGSAGGLLCIWDPRVFQMSSCCCNRRKIDERKVCSRRDKGMNELNDFVDRSKLNDLPLLGRRFTWCNATEGEKWSRIDRVLVDPRWVESFNLKLWGLPRVMSDHRRLLLMEYERDWGPRPFSEVFGNVNSKLKKVEDELHMIDLLAEERELEEAEKSRRREARVEAGYLTRMVERLWFQKSRLNWNFYGDKNTKYFHVLVKYRQGRNEINTLTVGDVVVDDPCRVKLEVLAYFRKQYSEDWQNRPVLVGLFKSVRDSPCFDMLEAEFIEAEAWAAVKGCDGNRAPSPDGFNLACI
ncbi:uncharacterized protein LOC114275726 [Camellia sinensis]|uniref:uncharacterized protein LOC114275726 n=1 Tax=Camellia sinensis TaxID=4442 RepID=UPI001035A871|nr:uncharacterized protein LOC114275726 [Camellia sinensis]